MYITLVCPICGQVQEAKQDEELDMGVWICEVCGEPLTSENEVGNL